VIFLGGVITLMGSLIVAAGRAGRRKMITPNARIGIRTPATTSSPDAWYAGQRAAGPWITAGGWVVAIGGLAIMLAQPSGADAARLVVVALVLCAVALVCAIVVANRAASAERDTDAGT
jgi:uncharacterized membrane protein